MSLYDDVISDASTAMMKRVLCKECARREIRADSIQGEELARVLGCAFIGGMTDERELACLLRNLID
ncbi:hypothetical protein [Rhizobium giardinii]|uniref:Uncharacterized protein n=1 Tax=Rhizobium giardinii TaxID=56731 RepID=A0A7W8X8G9_9HYPH|nr:hypothetical protein [Rhizobium giardinii]MBB5535656.1 hypothetical protein [Rhizobium giardinii]